MDQTDEYNISLMLDAAAGLAGYGEWKECLGMLAEATRLITEVMTERGQQ